MSTTSSHDATTATRKGRKLKRRSDSNPSVGPTVDQTSSRAKIQQKERSSAEEEAWATRPQNVESVQRPPSSATAAQLTSSSSTVERTEATAKQKTKKRKKEREATVAEGPKGDRNQIDEPKEKKAKREKKRTKAEKAKSKEEKKEKERDKEHDQSKAEGDLNDGQTGAQRDKKKKKRRDKAKEERREAEGQVREETTSSKAAAEIRSVDRSIEGARASDSAATTQKGKAAEPREERPKGQGKSIGSASKSAGSVPTPGPVSTAMSDSTFPPAISQTDAAGKRKMKAQSQERPAKTGRTKDKQPAQASPSSKSAPSSKGAEVGPKASTSSTSKQAAQANVDAGAEKKRLKRERKKARKAAEKLQAQGQAASGKASSIDKSAGASNRGQERRVDVADSSDNTEDDEQFEFRTSPIRSVGPGRKVQERKQPIVIIEISSDSDDAAPPSKRPRGTRAGDSESARDSPSGAPRARSQSRFLSRYSHKGSSPCDLGPRQPSKASKKRLKAGSEEALGKQSQSAGPSPSRVEPAEVSTQVRTKATEEKGKDRAHEQAPLAPLSERSDEEMETGAELASVTEAQAGNDEPAAAQGRDALQVQDAPSSMEENSVSASEMLALPTDGGASLHRTEAEATRSPRPWRAQATDGSHAASGNFGDGGAVVEVEDAHSLEENETEPEPVLVTQSARDQTPLPPFEADHDGGPGAQGGEFQNEQDPLSEDELVDDDDDAMGGDEVESTQMASVHAPVAETLPQAAFADTTEPQGPLNEAAAVPVSSTAQKRKAADDDGDDHCNITSEVALQSDDAAVAVARDAVTSPEAAQMAALGRDTGHADLPPAFKRPRLASPEPAPAGDLNSTSSSAAAVAAEPTMECSAAVRSEHDSTDAVEQEQPEDPIEANELTQASMLKPSGVTEPGPATEATEDPTSGVDARTCGATALGDTAPTVAEPSATEPDTATPTTAKAGDQDVGAAGPVASVPCTADSSAIQQPPAAEPSMAETGSAATEHRDAGPSATGILYGTDAATAQDESDRPIAAEPSSAIAAEREPSTARPQPAAPVAALAPAADAAVLPEAPGTSGKSEQASLAAAKSPAASTVPAAETLAMIHEVARSCAVDGKLIHEVLTHFLARRLATMAADDPDRVKVERCLEQLQGRSSVLSRDIVSIIKTNLPRTMIKELSLLSKTFGQYARDAQPLSSSAPASAAPEASATDSTNGSHAVRNDADAEPEHGGGDNQTAIEDQAQLSARTAASVASTRLDTRDIVSTRPEAQDAAPPATGTEVSQGERSDPVSTIEQPVATNPADASFDASLQAPQDRADHPAESSVPPLPSEPQAGAPAVQAEMTERHVGTLVVGSRPSAGADQSDSMAAVEQTATISSVQPALSPSDLAVDKDVGSATANGGVADDPMPQQEAEEAPTAMHTDRDQSPTGPEPLHQAASQTDEGLDPASNPRQLGPVESGTVSSEPTTRTNPDDAAGVSALPPASDEETQRSEQLNRASDGQAPPQTQEQPKGAAADPTASPSMPHPDGHEIPGEVMAGEEDVSPDEALRNFREALRPVEGDSRLGRALLQSILDDIGEVTKRRTKVEDYDVNASGQRYPSPPPWQFDAERWQAPGNLLPSECFRQLHPTVFHPDAPKHMDKPIPQLLAETTHYGLVQTLAERYTLPELFRGMLEFPSVQRAMADVEAEGEKWKAAWKKENAQHEKRQEVLSVVAAQVARLQQQQTTMRSGYQSSPSQAGPSVPSAAPVAHQAQLQLRPQQLVVLRPHQQQSHVQQQPLHQTHHQQRSASRQQQQQQQQQHQSQPQPQPQPQRQLVQQRLPVSYTASAMVPSNVMPSPASNAMRPPAPPSSVADGSGHRSEGSCPTAYPGMPAVPSNLPPPPLIVTSQALRGPSSSSIITARTASPAAGPPSVPLSTSAPDLNRPSSASPLPRPSTSLPAAYGMAAAPVSVPVGDIEWPTHPLVAAPHAQGPAQQSPHSASNPLIASAPSSSPAPSPAPVSATGPRALAHRASVSTLDGALGSPRTSHASSSPSVGAAPSGGVRLPQLAGHALAFVEHVCSAQRPTGYEANLNPSTLKHLLLRARSECLTTSPAEEHDALRTLFGTLSTSIDQILSRVDDFGRLHAIVSEARRTGRDPFLALFPSGVGEETKVQLVEQIKRWDTELEERLSQVTATCREKRVGPVVWLVMLYTRDRLSRINT